MFRRANLGRFGDSVPADMNFQVPEAGDSPWDFAIDHGQATHNDDGTLTEYGRWWEEEGFPAWRDEAIAATKLAEAELAKWQHRQ